MEIKWLQDLLALAERRSFSRAAETRNVTQSAFSRRIRALEHWLGAELVDRSKYPVELTPAGRSFAEAARDIVLRLHTLRHELGGRKAAQPRQVIFAAQHSLMFSFYPRWLKMLEAELGAFPSRLRSDNLPNCMQDLIDGEVDFVICFHHAGVAETVDTSGLRHQTLGSDRLVAVSAPAAAGEPRHRLPGTREAPLPYLSFGSEAPIGRHIEPVLRRLGKEYFLRTHYENAIGESLRHMASGGHGIAWLPESLIRNDLNEGTLVRAGDSSWDIGMVIRIYCGPRIDNPQANAIWDFLAARQGRPLLPAD